MDFTAGRPGPTSEPPTHLGKFHPYGLGPEHTADKHIGPYEYGPDGLVKITLRHRSVDGTSGWIDLTSVRETDTQPLDLLLGEGLRSRTTAQRDPAPGSGALLRRAVLLVDGVAASVDVIALDSSELCAMPAGVDRRIALIVEHSKGLGGPEPISIAQITSLDEYVAPAWKPGL